MRRRLSRAASSAGFVLLLGACEVHLGSPPSQGPPPPGAQPIAPPRPPAPVAAQPPAGQAPPAAPQPASAVPPPPPAAPLTAAPHAVFIRFPARIVHPAPLANAGAGQLNVQGLKLKLRVNRKCGPREVPPNSGHWIHLDCNLHLALTKARAFSPRKMRILLAGRLKLDAPVGEPAQAGQPASLDDGASAAPAAARSKPDASAAVLPQAVDHRKDGTEGPIEDQGQVGACTAFSLASAMDNGIRRQNKPDTMSPLHIWSHYGLPVIKNAGDENINRPIASWDAWPYDERVACEIDQSGDGDCGPYLPPVVPGSAIADPRVQSKIKDSDSKGHWRVSEYDEITGDPDTIAAILATGADVWFTMNIGSTWLNPEGDTIGDWSEGQIEGGHAVLFAGYRHKNGQRQFLVHNSWGKDWADQGFGYVSESMVRQFIKHAYKVVVADSSPPPSPSDPTGLTDDDCGEDQLVDSVTGQCATICPDDSRPANGLCDAAGAKKASAAQAPAPAAPPSPAPAPPASPPPRRMKLPPMH